MSGSNRGREYYHNKICKLQTSSKVKNITVTVQRKIAGSVSKSPIIYDLSEPFKLVVHLRKDAGTKPVFDKAGIEVNTCSDPSHSVFSQLVDDSVEHRRSVKFINRNRSKSQSPVSKVSQLATGKRYRSNSKDSSSSSNGGSLSVHSRASSLDDNYQESKYDDSRNPDRISKPILKARGNNSNSSASRSKSRSISSERYKPTTSKTRKSRSPHRRNLRRSPCSSERHIRKSLPYRKSRTPPSDRNFGNSRSVSGTKSTRLPSEKRRCSHSPSNGDQPHLSRLPFSRRKGVYTRADYERDQREKEKLKRKLEEDYERLGRPSEKEVRNKSPRRSDEDYERRGRYDEREGRNKSPRRSDDDHHRRRSSERGNRSPKRRPDEEYSRQTSIPVDQAYPGVAQPYYYYGRPDEYWPMMPAPMRPPFMAPYPPPAIYPPHRILQPMMQPRMPGMHHYPRAPSYRPQRFRNVQPRNLYSVPRMLTGDASVKTDTSAAALDNNSSSLSKSESLSVTESESTPIASTSAAIVSKNVDDNK